MSEPEIDMQTVAITLVRGSGKVQVNAAGQQHEIHGCGISSVFRCSYTNKLLQNRC